MDKTLIAGLALMAVMLAGCETIQPITGTGTAFPKIYTHKNDTRRTKNRVARHNEKHVRVCGK